MIVEITCGVYFGSLALVADGIHMSTHAIAFFITASAYSYSRHYAKDPRFVFGTGKVGELAAYTSAILLNVIALYILYEGISRFVKPVELNYLQALPVAFVGLSVNIGSGLLLGCSCSSEPNGEDLGHHAHGHGHGHSHGHVQEIYEIDPDCDEGDHDETFHIEVVCPSQNYLLFKILFSFLLAVRFYFVYVFQSLFSPFTFFSCHLALTTAIFHRRLRVPWYCPSSRMAFHPYFVSHLKTGSEQNPTARHSP